MHLALKGTKKYEKWSENRFHLLFDPQAYYLIYNHADIWKKTAVCHSYL